MDEQFWMDMRQALLMMVDVIERMLIHHFKSSLERTSELRKRSKL